MRNKFKLYGLVSIAAAAVAAIAITTSSLPNGSLIRPSADDSYTLTLNNENRWTSGQSTKDITTDSGKAKVQFSYSNCSEYASGHVRLNNGGTVHNVEQITSITSFYAIYTGTGKLQIQTSYDAISWGSYFDINSESELTLNSHPYYIRLQANGGYVDLLSVRYTYSCTPTEFPVVTETSYQLVENASELMAGDEVIISMMTSESASTAYTLTNTYNSSTPWYLKSTSGSVSDGKLSYSSSMVKWTVGGTEGAHTFTADNGVNYLRSYVNGTHYNVVYKDSSYSSGTNTWSLSHVTGSGYRMSSVCSSSTIYLEFSGTSYNTFKGVTSAPSDYYVCFFKEVSSSSASTTPVDAYDFTIADNGSYNTNSIYSNDKALIVTVKYSDGTQQAITSGYSFEVKNSAGNAIDPTAAFGETGTYTVYVTIAGIGTKSVEIGVERNLVMESISIAMSQTTFTTDDTIATVLGSYLTGSITYNFSDANVTNANYSTLSSKGLAPTLMYNSTSHSADGKFTDAGTYYLTLGNGVLNSNSITLTVNAIPVTSISVSPSTLDLSTKSGATQLTATVSPENATNQHVTWSSSNTAVATVTSEGSVSPAGEGTALITATAQDGSGKSGSCTVTVTAPAEGVDEGTFTYLSSGAPEIGSYVIFASDYNSSSANVMSATQGSNNRGAETATIEYKNNVYTIERESGAAFGAFLVEQGTTSGTYSFYDPSAEGYLYAASSSKNYLRTESTKSANSSFTISNSGSATITAQGSNTHNLLKYNSGSSIFSCYASGQDDVYLFTKSGELIYPTAISLSGVNELSLNGTSELTVGFTPENANVKNVTYSSSDATVVSVDSTGAMTGNKAGTATITATAQTKTGTTSATLTVTVKSIAVTGVTLSSSAESLYVGDEVKLTATVAPSNASNKNVTWSTSNSSVATVSDGTVKAIAKGSATITVRTEDGNKTATCSVEVADKPAQAGWLSSLSAGDSVAMTCKDATAELTGVSSSNIGTYSNYSSVPAGSYPLTVCTGSEAGSFAFKTSDDQYLAWTSGNKLYLVSSIDNSSSWTVSFDSNNNATVLNVGDSSRQIIWNANSPRFAAYSGQSIGSSYYAIQFYGLAPATPTDPTGITVNPSTAEVGVGGTKQLSVTYSPAGCNQNKGVTWESSNTNVATVDSTGLVSVKSTASAGQTATITATSTFNTSFVSSCVITVVEEQKADHTVLIYICGSDLESGNSLATGDINEMISVSGQPDGVNIAIETGGANKNSGYFSKTQLKRYHLANKSMVADTPVSKANMGDASTLKSFIEWGVSTFPAEKYGLVLWNHGGAMGGVCFDENSSDDSLSAAEVISAVSSAKSTLGMSGTKFEWIGYDACLMGVADIASVNADHFNYMIASEELEGGYGWDYDGWLPTLFSTPSATTSILDKIAKTFVADSGTSTSNDATLAVYDLSKMNAYISAFNTWSANFSTQTHFNNLKTIYTSCLRFGDSDHGSDYLNSVVDAADFVNKIKANSNFSTISNTALLEAINNLVISNYYGNYYKNKTTPCGITIFFAGDVEYGGYPPQTPKENYSTSDTKFTTWRSFMIKYGNFY